MSCRHILTFLALLAACAATAQTAPYRFQNITAKDGYNPSAALCFLQDSKGYIWFATKLGVGRYDGYSITRFANEYGNSNTLSGNNVSSLAEDQKGRIWIAAGADGLNCYDPAHKRFSVFRKGSKEGPALVSSTVLRVYTDSKHRLWIGYAGEGWSVYDISTGATRHFKGRLVFLDPYGVNAANMPTQFLEDKNGDMWIATGHALHLQDRHDSVFTFTDKDPAHQLYADNTFISIYQTHDSELWLGTWGAGLKKFNKQTSTFSRHIYDVINPVASIHNIVEAIAYKSDSEFWVATADKGLGIFNRKTGLYAFIRHDPQDPNSPLPFECFSVFNDRDGILWAGFYSGISRLRAGRSNFRFTAINGGAREYKGHITPVAFYCDTATATLYVGCNSGNGLYVIDEKTGRQRLLHLPGPPASSSSFSFITVAAIMERTGNELLILSNAGIFTYNTRTEKFAKHSLKDQDGRELVTTSKPCRGINGYWCCGGGRDGFYFIDDGLRSAIHYSDAASSPVRLDNADALVLLQENDTLVWVTIKGRGLCKMDPAHKTLTPVMAAEDRQLYPFALANAEGQLWFTTFDHSIFSARAGERPLRLRQWGEQQGIPSVYTRGIMADVDGNIWVTTTKGPVVLKKGGSKFFNFEMEHGGAEQESYYTRLYQAANKVIYTGTQREYLQWHPDSLLTPRPAPLLHLTSVKVLDKEWKTPSGPGAINRLDLGHDQNFISVSYNAIDYNAQQDIEYAYRMDGIDRDWVYAGSQRTLSYPKIRPGNYLLHIKAFSKRGGGHEKELTIAITIRPPFWQTWWFIICCVLVLACIVLAVFRYRLRQVRRESQMKAEFSRQIAQMEMRALRAQMNPHFLFNCLNSINRFIVVNDTVNASRYLTKFSKLIRLILDTSSADTTTLANEISLLTLYIEMESMRFDGKFTFMVETDKRLPAETMVIPSMIIQPYVENAIWHGLLNKPGGGGLLLKFGLANDALEVIVEDDGVGREKAAELKSKSALKEKSFGMQITGDRIRTMNQLYNAGASVAITDLVLPDGSPAGTRVTVHVPYNRDSPARPS